MIKILKGLRRLIYGKTYKFTTRKGSTSLNGASWTSIYHEMTENPLKLVSIEFVADTEIAPSYRLLVNGDKYFPFSDIAEMKKDTMTFIIPISIAANEYLDIEIRGQIKDKGVVIMRELAVVEVI